MKTYEEANCTLANKCEYTFTSTVPETTAVTVVWDSINNVYNFQVTTKDPVQGSAELFVGGKKQVFKSIANNVATFKLSDIPAETFSGATVIWDIGLGSGNAIVGASNTVTPRFVSVSPNTGSQGGTLLKLNIQGVGPATQGLQIVDSSGAQICNTIKIVKTGEVYCQTKPMVIDSTLSLTYNSLTIACTNGNAQLCKLVTNN